MENNAETRRRLSLNHANILSSIEGAWADRGHRGPMRGALDHAIEFLEKADADQKGMLGALRMADDHLARIGCATSQETRLAIRAAIAKAKGEVVK